MSNLAFDRAEAVANLAVEYSKVLVAFVSDDKVVHTSFSLAERMVAEIERRFDDVKAKEAAEAEKQRAEKFKVSSNEELERVLDIILRGF